MFGSLANAQRHVSENVSYDETSIYVYSNVEYCNLKFGVIEQYKGRTSQSSSSGMELMISCTGIRGMKVLKRILIPHFVGIKLYINQHPYTVPK